MISVYADGDTQTLCMRFEDEGRRHGDSSLKLLAVFEDDEPERAWSFLCQLRDAGRRSRRPRPAAAVTQILTPEPL